MVEAFKDDGEVSGQDNWVNYMLRQETNESAGLYSLYCLQGPLLGLSKL